MKGNSIYKIPEGKLVKISMDFDGGKIMAVKIFGDFFLHPERGIELIEKDLCGKKIEEKTLIDEIEKTVKKNCLELFGISSQGLATAILLAKEGAKNG